MKTIIAGSRTIYDYNCLKNAIAASKFNISTVISGTAKGADKLGEIYAKNRKIPLEQFPANWNKYGKSAGYIRNAEMAKNADALIALWDGKSKGTKHMIDIANKNNLIVFIWYV